MYDDDCGFCRWSLGVLLAVDRSKRLSPLPLGTREANSLLDDMPEARREESWHLVSPDGRRASAGAAAAPLLRLLPGGRFPAAALSRAPTLTERAYRWVADHRSLLSKPIPQRAKMRSDARIERRRAEMARQRPSEGGS